MVKANPAPEPAANPDEGSSEPAAKPDVKDQGSEPKPNEQTDNSETIRKLQSERDSYKDRLEKVESTVYGDQVEKTMKSFLSGQEEKYPDVIVEDLLNAESLEPEALAKEAKKVQDRFDRKRNQAIVDAQNTPPDALTDEEREKELSELHGTDKKPKGTFQDFMRLKLAPRKK